MSPKKFSVPLDAKVAIQVQALQENAREFFEERAAIIEYDGGKPRVEAERQALAETLLRFAGTDNPSSS